MVVQKERRGAQRQPWLPALPKEPLSSLDAGRQASKGRLDLQIARADYDAAARAQGWNTVTTYTDIELGVRRDSVFDGTEGTHSTRRGFEISLQLPIFDWGGLRRDAMNAQTLAAASRLEATARAAGSNLRESYSAYRTAYDIARHYRDEVIPLRKVISEENQLRYNGMLISVFELLADSRDQVSSVMAALNAEQQFWLADAALQASLIGKPTSAGVAGSGGAAAAEAGAGH